MSNNKPTGGFFDRNTILAIVLSFTVFFLWQSYVAKKYPKKAPVVATAATEAGPSGPQTNTGVAKPAPGTADTTAANVQKPAAEYKEQTLSYDSDFISFDLSSNGMGFKSLVLKQYTDRKNNPITYNQSAFQPLGATTINDFSGFEMSKTGENEFTGRLQLEGLQAVKTITIDPKKYLLKAKIAITASEKRVVRVRTTVQGTVDEVVSSMFLPSYEHQEIFVVDAEENTRTKLAPETPFKATYVNGVVAAFNSQYFALAMIPQSDLLPKVEAYSEGKAGGFSLLWETPQPVDQQSFGYEFYFGPKEISSLRAANEGYTSLIDYGFFAFIGKPLHWLLLYIYGLVFNWGIAICILTILLRTALMPLNYYSFKSMKKMQVIQPKLAAIKEKYKSDPARINQETLALMRSEKANPLSGCIPALMQIPIFFAFYAMIASSFELYKQPFYFWIHDLTLKDPFFILPVAGSLVFFIQQKMTPPSPGMDPTQQKMMLFMPLFITVFMLSTPSGLSLYFFVNALCGFAQQMYFLRSRTT